jgi:hypothetical protein
MACGFLRFMTLQVLQISEENKTWDGENAKRTSSILKLFIYNIFNDPATNPDHLYNCKWSAVAPTYLSYFEVTAHNYFKELRKIVKTLG